MHIERIGIKACRKNTNSNTENIASIFKHRLDIAIAHPSMDSGPRDSAFRV